jgi:hypothetical protein
MRKEEGKSSLFCLKCLSADCTDYAEKGQKGGKGEFQEGRLLTIRSPDFMIKLVQGRGVFG